MDRFDNRKDTAAGYDEEAEATGWFGPEVVFGLIYKHIQPGQAILDLGIGTGLVSVLFRKAGLEVHGMDISPQMLDACRGKGFSNLQLHDLSKPPYPYGSESMDHAVCAGVLHFFSDLSPVFEETVRIIRTGGLFAFIVGDRAEHEAHEIEVETEHTKSEKSMKMHLHSPEQIDNWVERCGLGLERSLAFDVFMDRERTKSMQAKAYVARKA